MREYAKELNSVNARARTQQQNSGVSAITHLNSSDWPLHS